MDWLAWWRTLISADSLQLANATGELLLIDQYDLQIWKRFCWDESCSQPSPDLKMASEVRAPSPTLNDRRPLSSCSTTISSPVLTSISAEATATSQRWEPPSLIRSRTTSETCTSPVTDYDPEKTSRSTTFPLPRRGTTCSLDGIEYALHGYPRLATFMGHEPGAAIYRRFASLNARILLYRQAEIVCLEHELDDLEKSLSSKKHLHHSIKRIMHASPGTEGARLWDKVQQLETALERYSQCAHRFGLFQIEE
jgi:hypothetical protein